MFKSEKEEMNLNLKHGRKVSLAMAMLMISSQPVLAGSLVEQKKQAESQKNAVESQLNNTESKINSTRGAVGSVQNEIQVLDNQISAASYELEKVNNEIRQLQVQIEQTKKELEEAKEKLEQKKTLFAKRLRVMYMANDTGYLDVILNSSDAEALIGNAKMISSIAEQDRELVKEMKEQVAIIEEKKLELERQNEALRQKQASVQQKKISLENANAQKISYMNGLINNLQAYEAEYNSMLSESVALENQINQLQAGIEEQARQAELARQREEAARAAAQAEAARAAAQAESAKSAARAQEQSVKVESANNEIKESARKTVSRSSQSSSSSYVVDASSEPIRKQASGSMYWPVPGHSRVSSPYGYRIHPILKISKMHTGIDIPAPSGTPTVSTKDGVVIASSFMRGYGNCIMVDHGGMVTVYAHLSSRAVSVGTRVSAGQTIGYVGSTGMSTGPHLHYEVRINGKTTNPMNYL